MNMIEGFARLGLYNRQTIGEAVHILALVINQFAGGDAIADTQYLDSDGAVRAIFGDVHIPAAQTSGAFLQRFTEETAEKLRQIIWQMQEKYLKKLAKRLNRQIMVSMDSTLYEVYGNCKEKSSKSYKGIFGYHPLLIHIHNTGELLDVVLRPGRDFTSADAAAVLEANLRRLKPYFDDIILLADSGFYEKAIVDVCEQEELNIKFIITCELNAPIKQRVTDPQLAWRAPQTEAEENRANIEHRDSHAFNYRLQNLKEALAKRGKNLKVRGELEVAEFDHQENFIRDFKYGLGTLHIPSKHFYGNYAYFLISMLSWNLKCWLLSVIEPELQIQWKRFRYLFVKVGAQIIKSARYVIIRFGKNFGRVSEFTTWFTRL
jgi:hypothetical protein